MQGGDRQGLAVVYMGGKRECFCREGTKMSSDDEVGLRLVPL